MFACLMTLILNITGTAGIQEIGAYGPEIIRMEEISLIPLQWGQDGMFGLIMNAVLFIPVGTAIPMLWKESVLKETVTAGFLFSLLIEISAVVQKVQGISDYRCQKAEKCEIRRGHNNYLYFCNVLSGGEASVGLYMESYIRIKIRDMRTNQQVPFTLHLWN